MYRQLICLLCAVVVSGAIWWACSPVNDDSSFPDDGSGGSGGVVVGGAGGSGGETASGMGGDGGFDPGGDAGLSDGDICEEVSADAQDIPLDMIVLLDRSASMGPKWDQSVQALNTFFNDPSSAGISVALTFFPATGVPSGDACNKIHYNPPHVPLGELPAYAPSLAAAMAAEDDGGGNTPTYGALLGTYEFATAYQDANPDRKVIVVFSSDGSPNSCPDNQNDTAVIAALASSAFNYNGVQTYVIAIQGSSVADLNQIAAAGGTNAAFDVTTNTTLFAAKMVEIREQALGCEYLIPEVEDVVFDPKKVNVSYIPGGSGVTELLPKADSLADCGAGPGWYYDNPLDPAKILLCPASCTAISNDPDGQITISFGCPSEVN